MIKFQKIAASLFISALTLCFLTSPVFAQTIPEEKILSYDSQITVNPDASLIVHETIVVNSLGEQVSHGIYRDFPTIYQNGLTLSKVGFKLLLEVKRDGQAEDYHISGASNGIRIYIGNENTILPPAIYTYEITYWTNRQLGFFADHDELYWNVTGNGWILPIDKVTATVILPTGITAEQIKTSGYTGAQGAQGTNFTAQVNGNTANFATTQALNRYEGLTIVAEFPKGFISAPSSKQKLLYFLQDNLGALLGLFGLIIILIYYFVAWSKVGKDPKKGTIIPEYEPPADMSPAEIRFLKKMGVDNKAFVAQIIEMATKGIILIEKKGTLFGGMHYLTKKDFGSKAISPLEQEILKALFTGENDTIKLKNENYEKIQAAKKVLTNHLKAKIDSSFFKLNLKYLLIGILLSIIFVLLAIVTSPGSILFALLLTPILLIINIWFGWLLKAPTPQGRKLLDQIEGFKWFLSVTEKDRMNFHNPPEKTPQLFEKYLPYALALGVENKWADQFSEIFAKLQQMGKPYTPAWYVGAGFSSTNINGFTSSLGGAFSSAISSSSHAPGSSSGGGGFSGGGGGGGGGGGW